MSVTDAWRAATRRRGSQTNHYTDERKGNPATVRLRASTTTTTTTGAGLGEGREEGNLARTELGRNGR